MAKYLITETCYINGRLLEPGEEISVSDGLVPGPHMTPRDDAAHRAVKQAGARMTRADPVEAMTTPKVGGSGRG